MNILISINSNIYPSFRSPLEPRKLWNGLPSFNFNLQIRLVESTAKDQMVKKKSILSSIQFWIWKHQNYGVPFYYLFPIYGYPKFIFLDIHNSFLDIKKSIYGYPKIHFWIYKNQLIIGYP